MYDDGGFDGSTTYPTDGVTVNTGVGNAPLATDPNYGATAPSQLNIPSWITNPNGSGGNGLTSLAALGGGLYGLTQANNLASLASAAFGASNPFGPYRAQYANQLSSLMANPSQIYNDPGYQASLSQGTQAVQRSMAAEGYNGSGNEAIALQQYGDSFASTYLSQQESLLANLAGANITPNYGAALQGTAQSAQIASGALNSAIYGASGLYNSYNGASAGTPASGNGGLVGGVSQ